MISFFKRVRHKLFKEKRFKRYFIYAIGEMILVVLGILIAFQINNWNENRKAKALSDEMVSELKAGIESDLEELENFIHAQKRVLSSQYIVSGWLKGNDTYHDSLSQHFRQIYISTDYTVNYSGYETLKKFGLRRVENDLLRKSIGDLYEIKYPKIIKFIDIYQIFLEALLENNSKHFNELNYMQASMKPLNIRSLKSDKDYSYDLNTMKNFSQLLIYQCSLLEKDIKEAYSKFQ